MLCNLRRAGKKLKKSIAKHCHGELQKIVTHHFAPDKLTPPRDTAAQCALRLA